MSRERNQRDQSGEVELADGEVVTIPRPDAVFPVFLDIGGTVDVVIEDGRIRMREEDGCSVTLGAAHKGIEDPEPYATLYAKMDNSEKDGDELYSELAFYQAEDIKALRDACDTLLRYRGDA